jgi:hypothetical protein
MDGHEDQGDEPAGELNPVAVEVAALQDLLARENRGDATVLRVGPWSAYLVVQACQMAVTRPGQTAGAGEVWRALATPFEDTLAGTAAGAMVAAGWGELKEKGYRF